jgi:Ran GTPase-activating protein (RanGAP) involved in mRNA processing and transport
MALAAALKGNSSLTALMLDDNNIDDLGAAALGEALRVNTSLASLHLYNNSIGDKGALSILSTLTECNNTLHRLELEGNDISTTIRSDICEIVRANALGIRHLHGVSELNLSLEDIQPSEVKLIFKELADNTELTTLLMHDNSIGMDDEGSLDIANALVTNRALKTIGLDNNEINDTGILAIAAALNVNTVLTKLFVNGNAIGPDGAIALAETLRRNSSLQVLELGQNCIGDNGTMAIADALKRNVTLTKLDLVSNNIRDKGARAMLKTLKNYNSTLMVVKLEGNTAIAPVLLETVKRVLASRQALLVFLKQLNKPLEKGTIPLVVQAAHQGRFFNEESELNQHETALSTAGFVFHVVRAAALNDSKVIQSRSDMGYGGSL